MNYEFQKCEINFNYELIEVKYLIINKLILYFITNISYLFTNFWQ